MNEDSIVDRSLSLTRLKSVETEKAEFHMATIRSEIRVRFLSRAFTGSSLSIVFAQLPADLVSICPQSASLTYVLAGRSALFLMITVFQTHYSVRDSETRSRAPVSTVYKFMHLPPQTSILHFHILKLQNPSTFSKQETRICLGQRPTSLPLPKNLLHTVPLQHHLQAS